MTPSDTLAHHAEAMLKHLEGRGYNGRSQYLINLRKALEEYRTAK